MNKAIEKVEAYKARVIGNAMEKAKQEYQEAHDFYNDTGYDRYFNKMNRLENTIDELQAYLDKDTVAESLVEARKELEAEKASCREKIKKIKADLLNKLFYLLKVLPECSEATSLERYIKELED